MTERKSARSSGSGSGSSQSGRKSASSLTDAVVAALAEVEKSRSDVTVPADLAKPSDPPPAKREDTAPFERPRVDATSKTGDAKSSTDKNDAFENDKTLQDSGPPAAAAVATSPTESVGAATADEKVADKAASVPTDPPPAERSSPTIETKAPELDAKAADEKITSKHAIAAEGDTGPKETPAGLAVDYFGRTDVGLVREHNEDNFLVVDLEKQKRGIGSAILQTKIEGAGLLFAVCDGMGGAAAGEVASQMAVDTIHEMMQNGGKPRDRDHFARRLVRSIEEAGSRIFAAAKMDRSRRGMGTTSTVAGLVDKTLFVGQVGDSRAYVLRGDQFALITKDQSLVNQLIEAGQLTEEEAEAFEHSNIILQALGTTEDVTVDLTFLELRRGDRLLMCSDGLSGLVHGDMIKEVVKSSRDLIDCANQLIAMANAGGGHDNITVVLAEFDGEDLKVRGPDDKVGYMQYPLPPEDPKDPDPTPRTPTMKSGGPKPGSDVKRDGAPMPSLRPGDGGASNRGLLIAVLLVVLVLVGFAVYLYSGGEAQPASRTTTLSTGAPPPAPTTNLHVLSNISDANLFVDGVSRGTLSDAMHVTVTPGRHHVEARRGANVVATTDVTATAGEGSVISLVEEPAPLPTDVDTLIPAPTAVHPAPSEVPSGADVPTSAP